MSGREHRQRERERERERKSIKEKSRLKNVIHTEKRI